MATWQDFIREAGRFWDVARMVDGPGYENQAVSNAILAVIAANDLCAVGAIGEFTRHGLSVPEEISVVGYDDSQIAGLAMVQLTSVRQSIEQFGASALSMLIERIADPDIATRANRMPTELVVRTTTAMCQPEGANT